MSRLITQTEQSNWPPTPSGWDGNSEYDQFLTAALLAPQTTQPITRRRLRRALRRRTGLARRESFSIVNDYCQHYGIFPDLLPRWKWLRIPATILVFGLDEGADLVQRHLGQLYNSATTLSAKHAIQTQLVGATKLQTAVLYALAAAVVFVNALVILRRFRQDSEARAKMALHNSHE